jgi:KTSC domain
MVPNDPTVKMVQVDADSFESVGYIDSTRQLFIKFRKKPMLCIEDMPRFRFTGLLNAPRKDAYYDTFIKDRFLAKEVTTPPKTA